MVEWVMWAFLDVLRAMVIFRELGLLGDLYIEDVLFRLLAA